MKMLKTRKSPGPDQITNEMLKCGKHALCKILYKIFKNIERNIPGNMGQRSHYTYPKKGNAKDPNNYRGITISSAVGKLFNTILNERLNSFLSENNIM